jgi:hypothetical protein
MKVAAYDIARHEDAVLTPDCRTGRNALPYTSYWHNYKTGRNALPYMLCRHLIIRQEATSFLVRPADTIIRQEGVSFLIRPTNTIIWQEGMPWYARPPLSILSCFPPELKSVSKCSLVLIHLLGHWKLSPRPESARHVGWECLEWNVTFPWLHSPA